jgi:hypothetical protein
LLPREELVTEFGRQLVSSGGRRRNLPDDNLPVVQNQDVRGDRTRYEQAQPQDNPKHRHSFHRAPPLPEPTPGTFPIELSANG